MNMKSKDNLLEARGIKKQFGGLVAIDTLDFEIKRQTIVSVIGPNGAGKTTFFNCITGFYELTEGHLYFDGEEMVGLSPDLISRMGIARTFQNIRLFNNMTVMENVMVGQESNLKATWWGAVLNLPYNRQEEDETEERARELLDFIGLQGSGDLLASNLPYGQQRRLEIARALAGDPKLLLLDEPTAGMNPRETAEMTEFIRRLRDELGVTILLIEHDMRVVMGISERITVIDYGKKIAEGLPHEIQNDPHVIEAYLGRGAAASSTIEIGE